MILVRGFVLSLCALQCTRAQDLFLSREWGAHSNVFHRGEEATKDVPAHGIIRGANALATSNPTLEIKTVEGLAGHDGWVFTILVYGTNLCLDIFGGDDSNGNPMGVWDCNGHESQLWFFDNGWYQIRWGGNMEKCLDAGSMQNGAQVSIWDCNGLPQQYFGWDSNSFTIYLTNSESDASKCLDVQGGVASGNAVWVWDCYGGDNQMWWLQSGITIRPIENYGLCLDVPGGNAYNGAQLWLWDCNGQTSQYWIFEGGTYQIKYSNDQNYCIDASNTGGGSQLMLWDCNGADQQAWGYDAMSSTLYLAWSSSDASQCMDLSGGNLANGGQVGTWSCNGCWNQEWQAWGPASQGLASTMNSPNVSTMNKVTDNCPALGPGPAPGPPSPPGPAPGPSPGPSGQFCWDEQPGWPSFNSQSDLQNDGAWSQYFQLVYGEVPSWGYPICIGSFRVLYDDAMKQAGVSIPSVGGKCGSYAGELFTFGQSLFAGWVGMDYSGLMIWHPDQNRQALPGNIWVEITHSQTSEEKHGSWMYYMPGSGVWWWMGNTNAFQEHDDMYSHYMGGSCGNGCNGAFNSMLLQACTYGDDTVQVLEHNEPDWKTCKSTSGTQSLAIELIDSCGAGKYTCGSSSCQYKAGWQASKDCNCQESGAYNCQGYVPGSWGSR